MKLTTIKTVLKKANDEFTKLFNSEELKTVAMNNSFITGGAITSLLLDEDVNDYDIYFKNSDELLKVLKSLLPSEITYDVSDYRVKILKQNSVIEQHVINGYTLFITDNAVTISSSEYTFQLITRFVGNPEEIHSNFDFVHTHCYYLPSINKLVLKENAMKAILTRELHYTGSKYPLASIIRTRKFIERGWTVNAGQYLKMAVQLNEFDLKDREVLREQLTGVDLAYFMAIIEDLQGKERVNIEDVMELVDKHFDSDWTN